VLNHLRRAVLLRDGGGLNDAQLLERFLTHRDEAAVEALVRRHGAMVMGVCRRVLPNRHDAEDAFQATFLVLVRKAASIATRELLANWLYGVAYNTALKARAGAARRRAREKPMAETPEPQAAGPDPWEDLRPLLDRELNLLPNRYRAPVVLCDLEGRTHKEAAAQLGCPVGTLSGRLARARALLAARLTRRGLVLSGAALAAVFSEGAAWACVPGPVAVGTVKAACRFAAGEAGAVPAKVAALAKGVIRSMLTVKLKTVTTLLLGVTLLVAGADRFAGRCAEGGSAPQAKPAQRADLSVLIRQLGSNKFAEREAARQALERVGEPALESLRTAVATAQDLETRRRAEAIIRVIERRWQLACFLGHTDAVPSVALSPDGRLALSSGRSESSPRLWDMSTGKEIRRFGGHADWVWDVVFFPDGKRALSCGVDGIRLWEVPSGKELRRFVGHSRQVYCVALSPDGRRALSGSQDNTARLWDVKTGKELRSFGGHRGELYSVAFSPDGDRVVTCSEDDTTRLWDTTTGKELRRFPGALRSKFAPDGRKILAAGRDNLMRLWDAETGKELRRFAGHAREVCAVSWYPDGKRILSGSEDGTVRLWDAATGRELRCLRGHTAGISRVAFTPDGRRALSASYDQTIRLWALPE
jgi:RNA polymerase sigma factor (sigma-70 family)